MVEDEEIKANLSMISIEEIREISMDFIEERLIKTIILILLTEGYVRRVEKSLKMEINIPLYNNETDLEITQLRWVENILEDFKTWKAFIDAKSQLPMPT